MQTPADFLNISELLSELRHAAASDGCGCAAALQIVRFLLFAHVWLSDTGEEKWLTRLSLGVMLSLAAQSGKCATSE